MKVGVVGCGYWGPNLVRNFACNPASEVLAICDVDTSRLDYMRKLYPSVATYDNFADMIDLAALDAVVVATPVGFHHAVAKAALLAGKHVLVEKPMASNSGECSELISLAQEGELILMVGHTYLYSEPVKEISQIIDSGAIGDLRYINCRRLNLGLFKKDINVAWDLAPHDLSIILQVMGEAPVTVSCQGDAHVQPGIEDVTNIYLTFEGHRFAAIQSSWLEPRKVRQMTFVGTQKIIVYDDLSTSESVRIYDVKFGPLSCYGDFGEGQFTNHYGDCHIPLIRQCEPLRSMCAHFIECVSNKNVPISCGNKGLELVKILEASSESLANQGGPVEFSSSDWLPRRADTTFFSADAAQAINR